MDSLCHPCITATHFSYRFPIFETSATALSGTTGILYYHLYVYNICNIYIYIFVNLIFILNIPSIYGNISHWHHPTQPPLLGGRERGLLQAPPPVVCAALATTALGLASRGEKPGRPTSHDLDVIDINVT